MAADGQVVFEINSDDKKGRQAIDKFTQDLEKSGQKWEKDAKDSTDSIGSSFSSMFSKIAAGAAAAKIGQWLVDFGKQAISAASDLQEVQNVVDVTFGDGARQIEAWAQTAATQFGLTETQAKRFTSTMGAMLKSSDIADDKIVEMSTDLAGLAADMASFYNMDFETAFQKIRSGISGETEPLKQLGINMSVANLEAFALTKGITKAFDAMSQGEQTMLRYQYLMQATADAQGDFARTSDGFANATRMLESNIEQLKANVGSVLMPTVTAVVNGLNDIAGAAAALTSKGSRTVLDDFAEIDLNLDAKLKEINDTAASANALADALDDLSGRTYTADNLTGFVNAISGSVGGLDAAMEAAKKGDYPGTIKAIAQAMADTGGADAATWETLLKAIGDNLPSATDATGADTSTADFLAAAAEAAEKLGGEYPGLWADFIGTLGGEAAGEMLKNFAGAADGAKNMADFAAAGNTLKPDSGASWTALLKALDDTGSLSGLAGAGYNLQSFADALNGESVDQNRADAWNSLLSTLSANAEALSELTGMSADDTRRWLAGLAESANSLDPNSPYGWSELYDTLLQGLPGLQNNATYLAAMAEAGNALKPESKANWSELLKALDATGNLSGLAGAGYNLQSFADALNGESVDQNRADAWNSLLSTLSANAEALSELTGMSADDTRRWLAGLAESANSLDPNSPYGWSELYDTLLQGLPGLQNNATYLAAMAEAGNALKPDSGDSWTALLKALDETGSLTGLAGAGGNLQTLADALNGKGVDQDRAQAWQTLLSALSANAEGLSKLTGKSAEETKTWLSDLAEGANALDPSSAEGWEALYNTLLQGLPGLENTEFGAGLFQSLNAGTGSAEANLRALGIETDDIADKQAAWLEVCNRLVKTIPGLSSIINTETGEVKGGTDAIREYVREWQQGQEKLAMLEALASKREALASEYGDLRGLQVDAKYKRALAERAKAAYMAAAGVDTLTDAENAFFDAEATGNGKTYKALMDLKEAYDEAETAAEEAESAYQKRNDAASEAIGIIDELTAKYGEEAAALNDASGAVSEWSQETKDAAAAAVAAAADALEALDKYYENVRSDTQRSVDGVVSGFQKIVTPADEAREKMADLTSQIDELNAAGKDSTGLQKTFASVENSIPSVQNMTAALEDQLNYLNQYKEYLDAARAAGVSDDILASLSDGSTQSFDYLRALATTGSEAEIQQLNALYAGIEAKKKDLTDALTEQRLAGDAEFQGLADAAAEAVAKLDKYSEAESGMERTVQGIADGIAAKIPEVQAQVDALNAALSGLGALGNFGSGLLGGLVSGVKGVFNLRIPAHQAGLDYVPFDNYLAALHEGESVLTAEESRAWRNYKYGAASVNSLDYDALGGVMRENVRAGGNVYLDGRTVGRVISGRQADDLRNLERSGWQK